MEKLEKIWKNWKKYGKIAKIWHRGNFRSKIVIFETGCGNLPRKNMVTLRVVFHITSVKEQHIFGFEAR